MNIAVSIFFVAVIDPIMSGKLVANGSICEVKKMALRFGVSKGLKGKK
jgi:hypothetical protein